MKMTRLYLTLILGFLFAFTKVQAQDQAMFSQYLMNQLVINPAYAGEQWTVSLTAMGREQWYGLEGAPSSQTFSGHLRLEDKNVGLGMIMSSDRIGATETNSLIFNYSYKIGTYHVPPSWDGSESTPGMLSFGISGGFTNYRVKLSELENVDIGDPLLQGDDIRRLLPTVGAGLFYSTNKYFLSLSAPRLIRYTLNNPSEKADINRVHYYLHGGYVFDLRPGLKFRPSILFKYVRGGGGQVDLNAMLLFRKVLWLGMSLRSDQSLAGMVHLQVGKKINLGFSYDYAPFAELYTFHDGTYEIAINYRFNLLTKGNRRREVNPVFY